VITNAIIGKSLQKGNFRKREKRKPSIYARFCFWCL